MIPKAVPLKSVELFRMAMTHRSATADSVGESYERLEYLGDAVLGLVVAQYLYEHHPDWDQGVMSKARSSVVQETPLAETAQRLGLAECLVLSPGEEASGGRRRPSILCDIFEAAVGAVYLESGLEKARWFVLEQLDRYLSMVSAGDVSPHDHKSRLQEVIQQNWHQTPVYRVVREDGASHERRFAVQVLCEGEVMGEGMGRSKKEAEQCAALDALEAIERAKRFREQKRADIPD